MRVPLLSDREGAHQSYQASPSELTHATFIFARNRCFSKMRRAHSSFRKRKVDKLNSSAEKCFWSLSPPKKIFHSFCNSSFPSLIHPDGSIAFSPTDKASLFGFYFLLILLLVIPMLLILLLNPSLTLYPSSSSLLVKFPGASFFKDRQGFRPCWHSSQISEGIC